jgi:hypothetical protein
MVTLTKINRGEILWFLPDDHVRANLYNGTHTPEQEEAAVDLFCFFNLAGKINSYKKEFPLKFDATQLTNHSAKPNAMVMPVFVGGKSSEAMIALTTIEPGTEVFQDYRSTCSPFGHVVTQKLRPIELGGIVSVNNHETSAKKYWIDYKSDSFRNIQLKLDDGTPPKIGTVIKPFRMSSAKKFEVWIWTGYIWEVGVITGPLSSAKGFEVWRWTGRKWKVGDKV